MLGYVLLGVVTAAMLWSLYLLVRSLPSHQLAPIVLLRSAARSLGHQHPGVRFLVLAAGCGRTACAPSQRRPHQGGFPLSPDDAGSGHAEPLDPDWSPGFVDYLFLAFNTSTAFSPTDSPVLSRWAKVLMMIQSSISLATLALLAARAVNIL